MMGANRTIIIPKGTLNSDEVNVVLVPRSLQNTTQPLLVRPVQGNRLRATSLPIWKDHLDPTFAVAEEQFGGDVFEEDQHQEAPVAGPPVRQRNKGTATMCSTPNPRAPMVVHMTSRKVNISNVGPPECVEVTLEAPAGLDQNELRAVMSQTPGLGPSKLADASTSMGEGGCANNCNASCSAMASLQRGMSEG